MFLLSMWEKGHLQAVCQEEPARPNKPRDKKKQPAVRQVDQVEEQQATQHYSDDLTLWTITGDHKKGYHVRLQINGKHTQMELDTGAAVSVMAEQDWNQLFTGTQLDPYMGGPLRGYSGQQLEVKGQKEVKVQYGEQKLSLPLVVIGGHKRPALLGRDWLSSLKLDWAQLHSLQVDPVQQLLTKYSKIFQKGVGTIAGYQADVKLKEGTKPIFKKCRSVAYALQPILDAELQRLQEEGIIEPVQASAWATPLVVVPKANGRIRVCGDYKVTVNRRLETKIYPLPTMDDIFARLAGCTYFTKLDLTQAYQQLLLDDESKKLLVVNTPKGLFQFTRLPYGVSTAPAIFQSVMDRILQGLPVACYLDNILVAGKSKEEHDQRLEQVLQRLAQSGIHLQKEKCWFCQTQVEYLGHCVDATGIHPTEKKLTAIKEAPVPTDTTQLRAFIGLMNYYAKFIPHISTELTPLYKLLEKDQKWIWSEKCETTFRKCKALLTGDAILVHYDSKLPIKLACDASSSAGFGFWGQEIP